MNLPPIPETPLLAAAFYAFEGLSVFPCEKKIPLTGAGGFKNATLDARQIARWWTDNPNAQVGLPTGELNHLFVLDIDGPEGERAAEKMHLPETFTVATRPGRFQLWFKQLAGTKSKCTAGLLGPQLDTRGDGGYIVAPPSIHHVTGKPYQVVKNLPWATAPLELLEPQKSPTPQQPTTDSDAIPQGRRHQTMLSIAGALRARHLSPEMVLAQLRTANERQCKPPLDDADLQRLATYVGSKAPGFPGQRPQETSAEVELQSFRDVTAERVRWLWHQRIPLGKLTLFVGDPGKGKSLVTVDIAARMSRGTRFPDGAQCDIGDAVFLSAEDDAADTIRPRLDAAGADVDRIHRVKAVKVVLADGATGESAFSLERDLEKLEVAIGKIPAARMLVVDPVSAYMGHIDTHRDAEVRRVLSPLSEFAARRRISVVGVMHLKKSEAAALLRISGSIGFIAASRVAWGFGEDPDEPEKRLMVPVKNNLAPLGTGLAYRIEATDKTARVVWEEGAVTLSANSVLSGGQEHASDRDERSTRTEAVEWLTSQLQEGAQAVTFLQEQAKKDGFSWATVRRAKDKLPIRSYKLSLEGGWAWELGKPRARAGGQNT
jgi:putative DNA primase/helicase